MVCKLTSFVGILKQEPRMTESFESPSRASNAKSRGLHIFVSSSRFSSFPQRCPMLTIVKCPKKPEMHPKTTLCVPICPISKSRLSQKRFRSITLCVSTNGRSNGSAPFLASRNSCRRYSSREQSLMRIRSIRPSDRWAYVEMPSGALSLRHAITAPATLWYWPCKEEFNSFDYVIMKRLESWETRVR